MKKTRMYALGAIAMMALPLTGCAVDSSQAEASDGITVACGSNEEICDAVMRAFEDSTGVPTTYVRLSGGEILARLDSRKGAAKAEFDVWWGGPAESFAAAADRELLEQYDAPGRADLDPRWMDEDGFWEAYMVVPNGLCVNTAKLGELGVDIETWDDLADPKLKNNVAMAHPTTSGTGFGMLATQLTRLGGDEAATMAYMKSIHPNILQYTKSGTAPTQMVVAGEIAVGQGVQSNCDQMRIMNDDEDMEFLFPSDGVGVEVGAMAVVAGAGNLEGAKQFIDWGFSDEAFQAHIDTGNDVYSPRAEGAVNGSGDSLDDVPVLADFDPVALGDRRVDLANMFAEEIAADASE